jgi:flagellar protein FliS
MAMTEHEVAKAYATTAARTVSEGPMLLIKLYDTLADDIELAKRYLEAADFELVDRKLQHAQKIVIVLRSSLKVDGFRGGPTLFAIYNTLVDLLIKANLNKDVEPLDKCQEFIGPLHGAWIEAVARETQREKASLGAIGMA